MLFWLFLIISVLLLVAGYVMSEYGDLWEFSIIPTAIGVVASIITLIMLIDVFGSNIGVPGKLASAQQEYDSLVFQIENKMYENKYDYDAFRKELIKEVQEWNKKVARGQAMQNDFWLGIFYADMYDQLELISLEPLIEPTTENH
jgi:hypothetical protein